MPRTVTLNEIRDDASGFVDTLKWSEIVEVTDGNKVIVIIYVPASWDEASQVFTHLASQGECQVTSDGLSMLADLDAFLEAPEEYILEVTSARMRLKVCRSDIYSCVLAAVPR